MKWSYIWTADKDRIYADQRSEGVSTRSAKNNGRFPFHQKSRFEISKISWGK